MQQNNHKVRKQKVKESHVTSKGPERSGAAPKCMYTLGYTPMDRWESGSKHKPSITLNHHNMNQRIKQFDRS